MGRELGRISGPLLADNLKRNGVNLAFETQLLYFDVVNSRIGINTSVPTRDLQITDNTTAVDLIVTTEADLANLEITTSQIQNIVDVIYIQPDQTTNPVINVTNVGTDNLNFGTNIVSSLTNSDINFTPIGTGSVNINSNTLINGGLHATGNITWDGNIILGVAPSDSIIFDAEVGSDILPSKNQTDNLGSTSLQWLDWYANTLNAIIANPTTLNSNTLIAGGVQITGNTISDINPSQDLTLSPNGTGLVKLNNSNLQIIDSEIMNLTNDTLSLANTAGGYWKFAGTNGLSIPSGNTGNRPQNPEIGNTRFNANLGVPEVYDPILSWHSLRGPAPNVTSSEVDDMTGIWALVLGL